MLLAGAEAARAGPVEERTPLLDVLEILIVDRELVAIDADSGGQRTERLERGERVLWHDVRGKVGVVLTDRRVLAVATRAGWQETRYRAAETPPAEAFLGERVALLFTKVRAIGFDGGSGNLVERTLGPREAVLASAVGENVALLVSDRRAFGLSPFKGGFFVAKLTLGERIEDVSAFADHATLTTSQRLLIFRATSGSFEERDRGLGR